MRVIWQYTVRRYSSLAVKQLNVPLKRTKVQILYRNLVTLTEKAQNISKETVLYNPKGEAGTYGKSFASGQNTTLENFKDIFRQCIYSLKPKKGEVVCLGDYGTADGRRTVSLFDYVIGVIKEKHGEAQQVSVVYNDLPDNDFNGLFNRLNGTTSYTQHWDGVFTTAIGKSFFEQIMPATSMDIIFSCHALQYLSTVPCCITNGLSVQDATNEEQKQWKEAAGQDWKKFLSHRANELKPGGSLILAVPVLSDVCPEAMYNVHQIGTIVKEAWVYLLNSNAITEEEYVKATINVYPRTEDELRLPFNSESFVTSCGLELKTINISPALYLKYEERHEDPFPRREFEQHVCDGIISVILGNIYYALSESRTDENKLAVIATFKEEILRIVQQTRIDSYQFPRADIVIKKTLSCNQ